MATATRISPEVMDVERGGPKVFVPTRPTNPEVRIPAPVAKSPKDRLFQNLAELAFPLGKGRRSKKTRKGSSRRRKMTRKKSV